MGELLLRLFEYFRWQLHTQKPNGAHVVAKREKMRTIHYLNSLGPKKIWSKSLNNTSKGQILLILIILNINTNNFMGLRPELLEKRLCALAYIVFARKLALKRR